MAYWLWMIGICAGFLAAVLVVRPAQNNAIDITIKCPKNHEPICQEMMDAALIVARRHQKDEGQ